MKRLHVNVGVADLDQSIRFYSTLFGAEPSVKHGDYAKWMLDDPRVNFAISTRGAPGLDHLGIQAESSEELGEIAQRASHRTKPGTAASGQITTYGGDTASKLRQQAAQAQPTHVTGPTPASSSCCAPEMAKAQQPASTCGAKSCG